MNVSGNVTDNRAVAVPAEVADLDREIARLNRKIAAKQAEADRIERRATRRMLHAETAEIDRHKYLDIAATTRKPYPTGFVYFITDGETVKIGFSAWPLARMATLQNNTPRKLSLLTQCEGIMFNEHEMHRRFSKLRVQGEWFRPNKKMMKLIGRLQRGIPLSEALRNI